MLATTRPAWEGLGNLCPCARDGTKDHQSYCVEGAGRHMPGTPAALARVALGRHMLGCPVCRRDDSDFCSSGLILAALLLPAAAVRRSLAATNPRDFAIEQDPREPDDLDEHPWEDDIPF